jgi:hypothetical protein
MDTLINNFDSLEQIIYEDGIRIKELDIHQDMDMILIILNTGRILQEKISKYPLLRNATDTELNHYELIGNGTGVHWPELDEDLSLKGFLRDTLKDHVLGDIKII